jgi:hypothetical protein
MNRIPQPAGQRGSLKWVQHSVNNHPDALNSAIGLGLIEWRSPLKEDGGWQADSGLRGSRQGTVLTVPKRAAHLRGFNS